MDIYVKSCIYAPILVRLLVCILHLLCQKIIVKELHVVRLSIRLYKWCLEVQPEMVVVCWSANVNVNFISGYNVTKIGKAGGKPSENITFLRQMSFAFCFSLPGWLIVDSVPVLKRTLSHFLSMERQQPL